MKLAVRRLVLAAAVPVVTLSIAGCSIHEQTQRWYSADNGVSAEAGDIGLRNVLVVSDGEGRATVVASFTNRGDATDELLEVVVQDVAVEPGEGALEIPAGGMAAVGPDAVRVDVDVDDVAPGYTTEVEFRFADAPRTTVQALVRPAEGVYAEALPAEPEPEPEDEPTAEEPTEEPSAEPSAEPTS